MATIVTSKPGNTAAAAAYLARVGAPGPADARPPPSKSPEVGPRGGVGLGLDAVCTEQKKFFLHRR